MSTLRESKVPRMGFIASGYKLLITYEKGEARPLLHRIGSEQGDESELSPDTLRLLSKKLFAYRKELKPIKVSNKPVSESVREQLRALGYFVD